MVIVEPAAGLPPVDSEFALVQSEWYLGPQGEPTSLEQGLARRARTRLRGLQRRRQPVRDEPIEVRWASASASSSSTPARASTARSTSSARSSTRVIKEGVDPPRATRAAGAHRRSTCPGAGRDRRVQDRGGRPLPDRDPRLQLRRPRRAGSLPGRRRRCRGRGRPLIEIGSMPPGGQPAVRAGRARLGSRSAMSSSPGSPSRRASWLPPSWQGSSRSRAPASAGPPFTWLWRVRVDGRGRHVHAALRGDACRNAAVPRRPAPGEPARPRDRCA